jgi:4-aminobutyrate aminotransferase
MLNVPSFVDLVARVDRRLAPSLAQDWPGLPVLSASGLELNCADGRTILDFTSGIATTNTGHCHPKVVAAAQQQTAQMIHSAVGITYHESLLQLCEALPKVLPPGLDMFFFGNSGAEAVEGSIKLARYVTGRPIVIAFTGGFHGRTYMAASITTAKSKYRLHYEPFVGSVYFAPYADPFHGGWGDDAQGCSNAALAGLRELLDRVVPPSQVACLVVEPVQGEGGYVVPPKEFLAGLRSIASEIGALLILDEVQTGFGRTGEMFAVQAFEVDPDVMAIGKAIASGFPLSATVASEDLMKRWLARGARNDVRWQPRPLCRRPSYAGSDRGRGAGRERTRAGHAAARRPARDQGSTPKRCRRPRDRAHGRARVHRPGSTQGA